MQTIPLARLVEAADTRARLHGDARHTMNERFETDDMGCVRECRAGGRFVTEFAVDADIGGKLGIDPGRARPR